MKISLTLEVVPTKAKRTGNVHKSIKKKALKKQVKKEVTDALLKATSEVNSYSL